MSLTIQPETESARTQSFLQLWGHVQHEVIYVVWALMDVALLTPFVLSMMGWARYWSPSTILLLILFTMLFAFNLTRLMSALNLSPERQQMITAVTLLLTIILFLRTMFHSPSSLLDFNWLGEFFDSINSRDDILWVQDVLLLFIIIIAWVRGIQLAMRNYSVERLGLRLRLGGLIFAPLLIWLSTVRLIYTITPFILLFFAAGLTAVALIRAEELEQDKTGKSTTLSPRWLGSVLLTALLVITTILLLTLILSGQTVEQVTAFFAPAIHALRILATVALTTIIYLLLPFFYLFETAVTLLNSSLIWAINAFTLFAKMLNKLQRLQRTAVTIPEESATITNQNFNSILDQIEGVGVDVSRNWQLIIVLIVIALILLVALMIGRLYRRTTLQQHNAQRADDVENEQTNADNLLNRLLRRFGLLQDWRTALSIRRIYHKMERAATASGYPRSEAETPYEYLDTLAPVWPDHRAETKQITQAYVRVRYGEVPESKEELDGIRAAWARLERTRPTEMGGTHKNQPTLDKRG